MEAECPWQIGPEYLFEKQFSPLKLSNLHRSVSQLVAPVDETNGNKLQDTLFSGLIRELYPCSSSLDEYRTFEDTFTNMLWMIVSKVLHCTADERGLTLIFSSPLVRINPVTGWTSLFVAELEVDDRRIERVTAREIDILKT
ncbi:hypothetical protein AJ79_01582 [Helicocarpus griseus UAMH5409]|uniref:Uncharacterized protein n=1 Tax=Helicocarpus griseus UAMH5409 TaxID=1447875 RepID=A0A2B7Y6H1_9EURO|nr:hypothetical protein AJ79_01582 [Helicocarpus griseus UAMH5409]